jgi:hypothetical protein
MDSLVVAVRSTSNSGERTDALSAAKLLDPVTVTLSIPRASGHAHSGYVPEQEAEARKNPQAHKTFKSSEYCYPTFDLGSPA